MLPDSSITTAPSATMWMHSSMAGLVSTSNSTNAAETLPATSFSISNSSSQEYDDVMNHAMKSPTITPALENIDVNTANSSSSSPQHFHTSPTETTTTADATATTSTMTNTTNATNTHTYLASETGLESSTTTSTTLRNASRNINTPNELQPYADPWVSQTIPQPSIPVSSEIHPKSMNASHSSSNTTNDRMDNSNVNTYMDSSYSSSSNHRPESQSDISVPIAAMTLPSHEQMITAQTCPPPPPPSMSVVQPSQPPQPPPSQPPMHPYPSHPQQHQQPPPSTTSQHPMPPSHAYRPHHPQHHYPQPPHYHPHPQGHGAQIGPPRHPSSQHHPMHDAPPQAGPPPPPSSHGHGGGGPLQHHPYQHSQQQQHHHPMSMMPPMPPPPPHYYSQHMNMANGPPPTSSSNSNGQPTSHNMNHGRPVANHNNSSSSNNSMPMHRMPSNGGKSVSSMNNYQGGPPPSIIRPPYSSSVSSPIHKNKVSWHSDDDMVHRRQMIQHIVELLKRREGSESPEWLRKLPQMVKQLEVALYRSAASFEEYFDMNTLKERLQSLAKNIATTKSVTSDGSKNGTKVDGGGRDESKVQMHNSKAIGPLPPDVRYKDEPDVRMHSSRNPNETMEEKLKREQIERQRNKQERLILLHHSSKCNKEEGTCSTPHCREMKQLWSHMAKCENGTCQVPHCYSSRAILSHYRKCKDSKCPVCGPVKMHVLKEKTRGTSNPTPSHQASSSSNSRELPSGPSTPKSMPPSQLSASMPPAPHHYTSQYPPQLGMPQNALPPITSIHSSGSNMPPQQPHLPLHPPYGYGGHGPPYGPPGSSVPMPYSQLSPLGAAHYRSKSELEPTNSMNGAPSNEANPSSDFSKLELERVRHKQQRLLLLRHASKCDAPEGTCTVTPHCAEMKKLWHHISRCQKNDCAVEHCLSSRYVLIHYRKCKDAKCPSCAPVRDAIKRGYQDKKRKIEPTSPPAPAPPLPISSITSVSPMPKRIKKEDIVLMPTLLSSLTIEQIDTHIKLLNREFKISAKELKDKCMAVLRILREHESGWVFNSPVDPVELGVPDYFDVIKNPMDLGTINKKLEKGEYLSVEAFDKDVRLTFDNAMVYNPPDTVVHNMAKNLLGVYSDRHNDMMAKIKMEEDERRHNERACSLCGEEKRLFEPPVFFCSGMNCTNTRIRRQQFFYVSGHAQYNWCNSCYNELDDKLPIELPESQIYKRDLVKKKNNEEPEENWVACDDCERWVHQICGLFNSRQNKDSDVKYSCPKCLMKNRLEGRVKQTEKLPGAADLPKTNFSEWLESHVNKKVKWKFERLAMEKAQSENIPFEQALKDVTSVGKITIRQVTSTDRKLEVRERMLKRYQHKDYPEQFPYRCKCILVFQDLDGIDVLLFALYVYEHGEDNPAPNTRTLYISYLDSVHFMRPPMLRTFVYHEILIAYLDFARRRGFASAHIWACPPMKGDDYIFFAKPADQKTPRDAMLQKWYIDMLTEGQKRGIVGRVTNMYDLYFMPGNDATVVPYLEGDYFSGEIENVIKDVEDGDKAGRIKEKEKKKKSVDKTKKMRKGTRSGGLDDDFIIGDEGRDDGIDAVMTEIGKNFKPMKDSFIVAFLNWEGVSPENMQVSKEIMLERERRKREEPDNIVSGNSLPKGAEDAVTKDESENASTTSSNVQNNRSIEEKSKIIDDDAEELDCEILENRQAFLNVCRAPNHYQFDELRRSKHTSMMILWHLHNRDAAKFVPCCFSCGKEILSGIRYACSTCTDFDLCNDCYHNPNANRGVCTHKLLPKAVDGDSSQNPQLTEAQRRDRKKHIKLHIKLLEHSSICDSSQCNSANCKKMKQYLQHSKECKTKQQGGCKVCKRILTLLKYHAQSCKNTKCPIPQCRVIRERIRMMARQQQAMDDRRRQMMNQNFRGNPIINP